MADFVSSSSSSSSSTAIGENSIRVERFSEMICDIEILAQVLLMEKSCMIWVSTSNGGYELGPLVVSMPTKFDKNAVILLFLILSPFLLLLLFLSFLLLQKKHMFQKLFPLTMFQKL